mmetsp:Transcript_42437/g.92570  ORF Transcript_42437/g.92570 Transcript_42437/m.92570 type:complete len:344 (-) Transcript_42437:35-1066(-)
MLCIQISEIQSSLAFRLDFAYYTRLLQRLPEPLLNSCLQALTQLARWWQDLPSKRLRRLPLPLVPELKIREFWWQLLELQPRWWPGLRMSRLALRGALTVAPPATTSASSCGVRRLRRLQRRQHCERPTGRRVQLLHWHEGALRGAPDSKVFGIPEHPILEPVPHLVRGKLTLHLTHRVHILPHRCPHAAQRRGWLRSPVGGTAGWPPWGSGRWHRGWSTSPAFGTTKRNYAYKSGRHVPVRHLSCTQEPQVSQEPQPLAPGNLRQLRPMLDGGLLPGPHPPVRVTVRPQDAAPFTLQHAKHTVSAGGVGAGGARRPKDPGQVLAQAEVIVEVADGNRLGWGP